MRAPPADTLGKAYKRSLWIITFVALVLCVGEVGYGYAASSKELLKAGIEWIYDVAIYGLSALSFGRSRSVEQRAAYVLALILGIGGVQGADEVWDAVSHPGLEGAEDLTSSAVIDVVGSIAEAGLLFRFRGSHDPVVEASWLSARNSIVTGVLGAAVTVLVVSPTIQWPQTLIDAFGALLAFQAAVVVLRDARSAEW